MNSRNEIAPVGLPHWRADALRLTGVGLAYVAAHKLAYFFPGTGGIIATIWPGSGIALAALLLNPTRLWPGLLGVCAAANLLVELIAGRSLVVGLGFILANFIETGLSAWVICRWSGRPVTFHRVSEILALIVAAVGVNGISALVGAASANLGSGLPFWNFYQTWGTADGLGILLATPLIVAFFRKPPLPLDKVAINWTRVVEGVVVLALAAMLVWAYFGAEREKYLIRPHSYMLIVPLIWAALRLGLRGTTVTLVLLAVGEIVITASGIGGYPLGGASPAERILWVQLFLAVKCVTALLLAAGIIERQTTEQSLRASEASLRALGDNLPNGMVYQVVREPDGTMRFVYLSASVQRMNGLAVDAVLRDPRLLYRQTCAADRPKIENAEVESLKHMSVFNVVVQMRREDGALRWMHICSQPRRLPDGRILWDGIETDITEQKQTEEQLRRVNRALRTISNCNQVLVRARSESELLQQICALIAEDDRYRLVWVGFAENDSSKTIRSAAAAGPEAGLLDNLNLTFAETPLGPGITGTTIRTGQPAVSHDLAGDSATTPDRAEAIRRGLKSALALPLQSEGMVFGALTIYSATPDAFDEAEIKLLTELADDLAFGIQALRTRATRAEAEAQVQRFLTEAEHARAELLHLLEHHKEAEEALRVSEERFRSAMEHSPIGMALAAPDGRWLEVNPALSQIVGYTPEELMATDYQHITHPDDLALDRKQLQQVLTRQIESYQLEKRYIHKNGQVVWIQLNISLVWNPDGTPRHFVTQVQNITERKHAEAERSGLVHDLGERLKELTALHRAARLLQQERPFDRKLLGDLVALLPPAWQFPEICEARVTYGGIAASTPRWNETPWKQAVSFTTSGGQAGTIEVVYLEARPPAGEGPFLLEERTLIESLADMLAAYLERKQAERALLDSRAKLVLAMEMARLAHWEYDVALDQFVFNDDFYQLFGTTAAQENGTLMSAADYARKFLPPEDAPLVAEAIKQAVATADPHYGRQLEHRFQRRDGTTGVMSVRFSIVKDAAGHTVKIFGANQDITEQKRAEEKQRELEGQLRQAQKLEALGTLAGGIAHDFNNILAAMLAFTELAKMDNPDNAELQDNLREVLKAGERAASLIRQILSFSRRQKQERRSLQLAPVIQEALQLLRSTLPTTIEIQADVAPELPAVLADPSQIHQVVMNLCTNAGHAMRAKHGKLHVQLDRLQLTPAAPKPHVELNDDDYVRLRISDTGHGMDAETLKRIFEPFFTTKAPGEGTGLGLSVVHGIVKEHDGVIAVESEPGRGTTFTIYFPAQATEADGLPGVTDATPPGRGQRVMFVDDEIALCNVAKKILSRQGYNPVAFSNPEAAWNAIQSDPQACELLVTDLTMPVMTGVDLARKVSNLRPGLPIILTSGFSGTLTLEVVQELGIRELLQKPLDYHLLGAAISRALK